MNKAVTLLVVMSSLVSCASKTKNQALTRNKPDYQKEIYYDGIHSDLLTAGLGLDGLRGPAPELNMNASADVLRKASYYHQFKAMNDLTEAGGYGRLFGITGEYKPVAGVEYWAQRRIKAGALHTTVVQIPDGFDVENPCLIVAPSSGSRNVFGAVGTSGAWGLMQSCAVSYTDKGTGTEIALKGGKQYQIDGIVVSHSQPDEQAKLVSRRLLSSPSPLHVAQVHAYSEENPEQYWGDFVLDAASFGLDLIQSKYALTSKDVHVIAASVSNGGGAVLRAAEHDKAGIIDAVVAAEPQVNVAHRFELIQDENKQTISSQPLIQLSSMMSLYEPCASLDESLNSAPFKGNTALIQPLLAKRCQALADAGWLTAQTTKEQASEAIKKIALLQIESSALQMAHINTLIGMWPAINHTYANSYLQKEASDNLCQSAMSAFAVDGTPRELSAKEVEGMFALSNGIAPGNGVELAYTNEDNQVVSKMMFADDMGLKSQLCFYHLGQTKAIKEALQVVMAKPERNHKPTIILHGQADSTVAVNHASRAYFHRNQSGLNPNQNLKYFEIQNAQHFDAFLAYPGFKEQFLPMHPYFEQSMLMMLNHLRNGQPLAQSQVIKTAVRGQKEPLTKAHIPAIKAVSESRITATENQLVIHE